LLAIVGAATVLFTQYETSKVSAFESWKAEFGMHFESEFENAYRERVFLQTVAKIEAHNSKNDKTYEMGINKFSALTQEEFEQSYLGTIIPQSNNIVAEEQTVLAADIDWVAKGAVTAPKDQGNCGSCWAFSTTGSLEGLSFQLDGKLRSFSEQQLVDCSGSFGNQACQGGLMDNAFKYVKANGITLESSYAYTAKKGTCKTGITADFKIGGFVDIKKCEDLANAIQARVISVAVDASNWSTYKGGVFNNCKTQLNHGVTLTGISSGSWVIKNSWGATWGEKGGIRLAAGNTCGICNVASYPTK